MDKVKRLIKEILSTPPKKEKCNCGCHSCENVGNPGPVLNESLNTKIIMTENMTYHVKNKLPIAENMFRYGSESFLDMWAEARYLYSRNAIHVNDLDKEILLETNLGEYGIYEGQKVPLDLPMIEEGQVNEAEYQGKDVQLNKPKRGGSKKFYVYVMNPKTKKVKKVQFGAAGGGQNLAVKIRDPKARRAFASRQNCDKKKDRTTPGYWSCNIGRYWKSLGGGSNFSGYW